MALAPLLQQWSGQARSHHVWVIIRCVCCFPISSRWCPICFRGSGNMVEKCTPLENVLQHRSCGGDTEGFHRILQIWQLWTFWKRRAYHVWCEWCQCHVSSCGHHPYCSDWNLRRTFGKPLQLCSPQSPQTLQSHQRVSTNFWTSPTRSANIHSVLWIKRQCIST